MRSARTDTQTDGQKKKSLTWTSKFQYRDVWLLLMTVGLLLLMYTNHNAVPKSLDEPCCHNKAYPWACYNVLHKWVEGLEKRIKDLETEVKSLKSTSCTMKTPADTDSGPFDVGETLSDSENISRLNASTSKSVDSDNTTLKAEGAVLADFETTLADLKKKLTEQQSNFSLQLTTLRQNTSEDLENVKRFVTWVNETVHGNLSAHQSFLKQNNETLNTLLIQSEVNKNLTENITNVLISTRELNDTIFGDMRALRSRVDEVNQTIYKNISVLRSQVIEDNQTFYKNISVLRSQVNEVNQTIYKNINVLRSQVEEVNDKMYGNISDMESQIEERKSEEEKLLKRLETLSMSHSYISEASKEIESNLISFKVVIFIGVVVSMVIAFWVIFLYLQQQARIETSVTRQSQVTKRPLDYRRLLWDRPIDNSVCVIAFHSQTQREHVTRAESVFRSSNQTPPSIMSRHVGCHEDIVNLPGCRVFLLFVDVNDRNIILEDPTRGLGDLRVTTVRSLWKFGADVTVIYCGHLGSKDMTSDLYNQRLSFVNSHNELSQLRDQRRLLSVYDEFSDYQSAHVRNLIKQQLRMQ